LCVFPEFGFNAVKFNLFQATIEEAAAALEKLMLEAKANEQSKPNIDVDMKILDSCCKLFAAIQVGAFDHSSLRVNRH
jgi:hypothetical protein